jgi:hypothetical protein
MDDAVRNLEPITMDKPTLDLYSKIAIGVGGTVVTAGVIAFVIAKVPAIQTWVRGLFMSDAERQQANRDESLARIREQHAQRTATTPLLSNAPPVTGGRRLTRHRKNHNRKTRAKRRT